MKTMIQKWGNSLALRIPKAIAAEIKIAEGDPVDLQLKGSGVLLKPHRQKRYHLRELVKGITAANRHTEISFGKPEGREVW